MQKIDIEWIKEMADLPEDVQSDIVMWARGYLDALKHRVRVKNAG